MKKKQIALSQLKLTLNNLKLGFQICFSNKRAKSYRDLVEAIRSYKREESILVEQTYQTEETRQVLLDRLEDRDYGWNRSTSKEQKSIPSIKYSKHTESKSIKANLRYEKNVHQVAPYTRTTPDGMITEVKKVETL